MITEEFFSLFTIDDFVRALSYSNLKIGLLSTEDRNSC